MAGFFQRLAAVAPWATLALLLAMFAFVQNRLVLGPGVELALPETSVDAETEEVAVSTDLVALVMPASDTKGDAAKDDAVKKGAAEGVLVFFDDARYALGDVAGAEAFERRLKERAAQDAAGVFALLADRRVSAGDLMRIMRLARRCGVKRVMFLEKRN